MVRYLSRCWYGNGAGAAPLPQMGANLGLHTEEARRPIGVSSLRGLGPGADGGGGGGGERAPPAALPVRCDPCSMSGTTCGKVAEWMQSHATQQLLDHIWCPGWDKQRLQEPDQEKGRFFVGVYGHTVVICPFQDEEEEPAQERKARRRSRKRRGRGKLQQQQQPQQQQEIGEDGWEVYIVNLVAELCPGCGAYGHTLAICPTQYEEGEYLLVPSQPLWENSFPLPAPPADDECLLVPPQPPWEDCLPLPPPPAEGKYLLVPPQPPWEDCLPLPAPPAEGEYLLVPSQPPWENSLPLPPPPAEGEYLLVPSPPPPAEGEYLLVPSPPPPAEGEYLLVPPPPSWEGLLLPCLALPKDACHASPGAACGSASPGEPPVTGYEGEVELPLPPPWREAPLPSSPPEGPLLLPSPPEGPLLLPSPPEGQLLLPSPPEGPLLLLLPSPPEGPDSPGVATNTVAGAA
ncbi:UNVERIFIED_CONTAM: hypothetical protein FKN15_075524 [Acipenser sinensis]